MFESWLDVVMWIAVTVWAILMTKVVSMLYRWFGIQGGYNVDVRTRLDDLERKVEWLNDQNS